MKFSFWKFAMVISGMSGLFGMYRFQSIYYGNADIVSMIYHGISSIIKLMIFFFSYNEVLKNGDQKQD